MNKINAKINADEFTPWQDSLDNVFKSLQVSKRRKPWNCLQTIQLPHQKQHFKREKKARSMMSRTFLNISKINLHNSSNYIHNQELQHSESRRYTGPRITFYAQMNPKIGIRSRSSLNPQQQKVIESSTSKKKLTSKFVRDESIKYLQIIDEKPKEEKIRQNIGNFIPKTQNLKKIGVVKARKNDEQHVYLRRLKMIYRKN